MSLHDKAFEFIQPSEDQKFKMDDLRAEFMSLARYVEHTLPEGPDKNHVLRLIRSAGMWANVAVTRFHDGTPR